jgi:hypothetical protein
MLTERFVFQPISKKPFFAFLPEYLIQLLWLVHLKGLVEGVGNVLGLQLLASPEKLGRNNILLTTKFTKNTTTFAKITKKFIRKQMKKNTRDFNAKNLLNCS